MDKNTDITRADNSGLDHADLSHLTHLPLLIQKSAPVVLARNALQLPLDDSDDPASVAYGADTDTDTDTASPRGSAAIANTRAPSTTRRARASLAPRAHAWAAIPSLAPKRARESRQACATRT
ncbi:hypothetical protein HETIRDRAFT_408942 [Heterobasidion irregulare TC 32-1]|uniref:Uncharacterized protein n=1 Tax=Heterobasidion irregulare (strain TC 32-1) TaxID=747525 RepID=W4KC57_HETIT|nr:uncharacterized protein HETIRDRAFT_408942 [Heterobasidion irregulare TC 32-1]ETW82925.1 hypothetical protein HETIRDRAFT_408942 [Heterobasidion irregulare TC 32-1]